MREFEVTSFAQSLVECGAACVQHHKVASTFQWEGAISQEKEWAVQIKVSNQNKQHMTYKFGIGSIGDELCVTA